MSAGRSSADTATLDAALAEAAAEAMAGPCAVPDGTPVVVACSGGGDSVALVALMSLLAERWPLAAVVFVDHGLREVSAERRAAEAAARRAAAPFQVARVVLSQAGNLQAAAREARYAALERAAPAAAVIATAHSQTDQAETVLQRLLRGAGLRGLGGIRWRDGRVVRPLLGVSRARLRALGLPYAEDPTNATGAYQRNRLRHGVLPLLVAENPSAEAALALAAEQAQRELSLVDALIDALGPADPDLTGVDPELAAVWVRWRLEREGQGAAVSGAAARLLAQRLASGVPRAAVTLNDRLRGVAMAGHLRLEVAEDPRKVLVAPAPGTYRRSCWVVDIDAPGPPGAPDPAGASPSTSSDTVWFDASSLVWPLRLRLPSVATGRRWEFRDGTGAPLSPTEPPGGGAASNEPNHLRVRTRREFVPESTDRVT